MRKLIMSIILGSACCVAQASTKTIWVDGVNKDGGWYDVNKENPWIQDGDNDLCWAATATNLITWWQSRYSLPSDIPNTEEDIWNTFKDKVKQDMVGDIHAAIQWWISGVYLPVNEKERARSLFDVYSYSVLDSFDGYYFSNFDVNRYDLIPFLEMGIRNTSLADPSVIERDLLDLVSRGCGVGLSITNDSEELAHAITLWGIEYDTSNNQISKLWLTDSDDKQNNRNLNGLFSVDVTENNDRLYISTTDSNWYDKSRNAYIDGIFAVNPKESDTWGIPLARSLFTLSIPEPSTAALSLLALAGLSARRRRGTY